MKENPYKEFQGRRHVEGELFDRSIDLHRPYVDSIVLVSSKGEPMRRESDLIDVWFDSGAMPYAQVHYPFEQQGGLRRGLPRRLHRRGRRPDARLVLHAACASPAMLFDSVAFKNIISNGLVLDKNGNKMSQAPGQRRRSVRGARHLRSRCDALVHDLQLAAVGQPQIRPRTAWTKCAASSSERSTTPTRSSPSTPMSTASRAARRRCPMAHRRPEIDRWIISLLNTLVARRHRVARRLRSDPGGPRDPGVRGRKPLELVRAPEPQTFLGRRHDPRTSWRPTRRCTPVWKPFRIARAPFAPFISDRIFTRPERRERPPRRVRCIWREFPAADPIGLIGHASWKR